MKYDQAMQGPGAKELAIAVDEEHDCMIEHEVFQTVHL
jgi:hypothetical protein